MKKVIISFVLLLGIFTISSCSNEEDMQTSENLSSESMDCSEQLNELRAKILVYNQAIQPTTITRGWKWWKWVILGASDAVGGFCGGLFGGVSASTIVALAWASDVDVVTFNGHEINRSMKRSYGPEMYSNLVINSENFIESYSDSVGLYHNESLIDLCSDSTTVQSFNNANNSGKIALISSTIQAIDNANYVGTLSDLAKNVVFTKANIIKEIADISMTLADFMDGIRNISGLLGTTEAELDVLEAYFDGLSQISNIENRSTYMNAVLYDTDRSNIPSEIKVKLGNIMILANASFDLWSNSSMAE